MKTFQKFYNNCLAVLAFVLAIRANSQSSMSPNHALPSETLVCTVTSVDAIFSNGSPGTNDIWLKYSLGSNTIFPNAGFYNFIDANNVQYEWTIPSNALYGYYNLNYTVSANNTPNAFYVGITGIQQVSDSPFEARLFPNPFSKSATLKFLNPHHQEFQLKIYDNTGRAVRFQMTNSEEIILNRGSLLNGVYLFQLQSKEGPVEYGKFVIN